jgi:hypothetical protein
MNATLHASAAPSAININYDASPTCAEFMRSPAFGRLIAGPVGSGKTTACIFELFRRACEQAKAPDGIRYSRFAILRQTLSQLKQTVLKDIQEQLKGMTHYKVSENTIFVTVGDVRSEWVLIPLEDLEDQRRLLSMQLTGAWISEGIEISVNLIDPIAGRCGRYPSAAMGGATWHGLIIDTNMPAEGSDWHKFMVDNKPEDWEIFIQPGGLEDIAENLNWLTQTPETLKLPIDDPLRLAQGRKYYERLARSNGADWIRRYVHAQFGDDPSGTAVFRESFKSSFHVVDMLEPVNGHPLLMGQDFGRDPCSLICQVDHRGRLLVLQEVIAEGIGLELHIERAVRPALMDPRYLGRPVAVVGDPAGIAKSSISEETSFDCLKRLGFSGFPAQTNDIDPRLRAVESWLLKQSDGGGGVLIDRGRCPVLVRALSGGYRYGKTRSGVRKPLPEKKHPFSDIIDAFQYVCLVAHGRMSELMARHMQRRGTARRKRVSAKGWT